MARKRKPGSIKNGVKKLRVSTSFRNQAAILTAQGKVGRTQLRVEQQPVDQYNDLTAKNAHGIFQSFLYAEPTISASKANELVLAGQPRIVDPNGKLFY